VDGGERVAVMKGIATWRAGGDDGARCRAYLSELALCVKDGSIHNTLSTQHTAAPASVTHRRQPPVVSVPPSPCCLEEGHVSREKPTARSSLFRPPRSVPRLMVNARPSTAVSRVTWLPVVRPRLATLSL
jgi:hypothetical protein